MTTTDRTVTVSPAGGLMQGRHLTHLLKRALWAHSQTPSGIWQGTEYIAAAQDLIRLFGRTRPLGPWHLATVQLRTLVIALDWYRREIPDVPDGELQEIVQQIRDAYAQATGQHPEPSGENSPYYPGASAWYLCAAREAIPAHFPEYDAMPDDGGFGVWLLHAQVVGRVTVALHYRKGRTVHDCRPRRGTEAEQRWLTAREEIEDALTGAGFGHLTRTRAGLLATAPPPKEPTPLHLAHENVFTGGELGRYRIWHPDHPRLVGRLQTAHVWGPQAFTYAYGRDGDPHPIWPRGFRTLHAAAEAWALHCGMPTPVTLTEDAS